MKNTPLDRRFGSDRLGSNPGSGPNPGAGPRADSEPPEQPSAAVNQVFTRLLGERIILLGSEVKDENANEICAALLLLAAQEPDKDISIYINSPGGSVTAGMAVYDTMQFVKCDISTVAMGLAASMGQFLLTAGTKGKRYALPHARILMHQPLGGIGGSATDIRIQAEQILLIKKQMAELTSEHTGQPIERIEEDWDRDRWFTADQAQQYGLVDRVMSRAELGRVR
jgi:ATP-dependent Clp protease protease subunit